MYCSPSTLSTCTGRTTRHNLQRMASLLIKTCIYTLYAPAATKVKERLCVCTSESMPTPSPLAAYLE